MTAPGDGAKRNRFSRRGKAALSVFGIQMNPDGNASRMSRFFASCLTAQGVSFSLRLPSIVRNQDDSTRVDSPKGGNRRHRLAEKRAILPVVGIARRRTGGTMGVDEKETAFAKVKKDEAHF